MLPNRVFIGRGQLCAHVGALGGSHPSTEPAAATAAGGGSKKGNHAQKQVSAHRTVGRSVFSLGFPKTPGFFFTKCLHFNAFIPFLNTV